MTSVLGSSESLAPLESPRSPPTKKEKRTSMPLPCVESPPHISPRFSNLKEVLTYDKDVVDEFVAHMHSVIERTENECIYWATMYEESQKEIFELREKLRAQQKDEADYIDPEAIPNAERRSSRPSLDNRAAFEEEMARSTSRLPQGWFSLKSAVKSAVSTIVGGQYATVNAASDDSDNNT
jgi:hypothetical protein